MAKRALTSSLITALVLLAPVHLPYRLGSASTAGAAAAENRLLYKADWSQGMSGWTGSTSWKTVSGMLVNDGSEHTNRQMSVSAPVNLASTPDYTVEADIQLVRFEGGEGSFGIVARADGDGWGYNGGACNTHEYPCTNAYVQHWAAIGYGRDQETIGHVDFTPDTDWHHYALTVSRDTIGLTIDNRLVVGPVTDNRLLNGGRVGLWSDRAQINVRSFVVSTSGQTKDCKGQQIPVDQQCPPQNPPSCAGGGAASPGKFNVDACRDLPGLDTGINVPANSTIQTSATGTAHYGQQKDCSSVNPDGQIENGACSPKFDKNAVLPSAPIGELLARIGASGAWFAVGSAHSGTTPQAGELFLIFNDVPGLYGDNDGTYRVSIDISPPSGGGPPRIVKTQTYTEGQLVYLAIFYTDDDNDATGFGFRGANGSGWGEENHPFSNPSYGRVSQNRVDYPFNHLCGTSQQYESDVEAWIYDSQGLKSQPVVAHLACSAPTGSAKGQEIDLDPSKWTKAFWDHYGPAYEGNADIAKKGATHTHAFGNAEGFFEYHFTLPDGAVQSAVISARLSSEYPWYTAPPDGGSDVALIVNGGAMSAMQTVRPDNGSGQVYRWTIDASALHPGDNSVEFTVPGNAAHKHGLCIYWKEVSPGHGGDEPIRIVLNG